MSNALPKPSMIVSYDLGETFGIDKAKGVMINGFEHRTENVPMSNPDYYFSPMQLTDYLMFHNSSETSLQIIGHTGTGKSSFVEEFHARLNLPLYVYNAHPRTSQADLIGEMGVSKSGGLQYNFGPVALAAKYGCTCLIDEYNLIDPGEATGLNALLEGRSVFIKETDEWLHPMDGFKIVATINPKTSGYVGRNDQDAANDDRFMLMYAEYMDASAETDLILKLLSRYGVSNDIGQLLADQFRQVANSIRENYMGSSDSADALDTTISTRSLLRWVGLYMQCKGVERSSQRYSPVHYSLERAKTFKASNESRVAIHDLVHQVFGDEYRTPMSLKEQITNPKEVTND